MASAGHVGSQRHHVPVQECERLLAGTFSGASVQLGYGQNSAIFSVELTIAGFRATPVSRTSIQFNWRDFTGETGYRLYRWNAAQQQAVVIATVAANVTAFRYTNANLGTREQFLLQAFNSGGVTNTDWEVVRLG